MRDLLLEIGGGRLSRNWIHGLQTAPLIPNVMYSSTLFAMIMSEEYSLQYVNPINWI